MSDQSRGRRRVEEITAPQRRTLQELRRFIDRQGFPPTIQELADVLGISPPSVHSQVKQLVRKGYVKRESKKARGLTIVREPSAEVLDLLPVPILGKVAAGQPILAEQNIVGEVLVDSRAEPAGDRGLRIGPHGLQHRNHQIEIRALNVTMPIKVAVAAGHFAQLCHQCLDRPQRRLDS